MSLRVVLSAAQRSLRAYREETMNRLNAPQMLRNLQVFLLACLLTVTATAQIHTYGHDIRKMDGYVTFGSTATPPGSCEGDEVVLDNSVQATSFTLNPTLCVEQDHRNNATLGSAHVLWKKAYVGVRIKNLAHADIEVFDAYDYTVTVNYTFNNGSGVYTGSAILPLSFSNDPHETHHHVRAEMIGTYDSVAITSFSVANTDLSTTTTLSDVEKNFEVFVEMHEEVYDPSTVPTASNGFSAVGNGKNLKLTWPASSAHYPKPGWFQVEWKYIPETDGTWDSTTVNGFKEGATRIVTDKTFYTITNHFAFDGKLLWRVRYVRPFYDSSVPEVNTEVHTYGPWHSGTTNGEPVVAALDGQWNWQYDVLYTEEGHRKESMGYFDGTMRPRQNLFKLEEQQDMVIAGSQFYNYGGVAAINVLPAPVQVDTATDTLLAFHPGLNLLSNTSKDSLDVGFPDAISTTTPGASQYYSTNNPWAGQPGEELIQYVPEAGGYPFVYTNMDGQGRPLHQSQPGPNGRIELDTSGLPIPGQHFTRYAYAQPSAAEIDMYFGNQAFQPESYSQVIATDPNEQTTVSVQDHKGRTVMTYLCDAPNTGPQLDIDTKPEAIYVFEDLLGDGKRGNVLYPAYNPRGIGYEKTLFINERTEVAIDYHLEQPNVKMCGGDLCYDCLYNIEFELTNEQNDLLLRWVSVPLTITPQNVSQYEGDCDTVEISIKGDYDSTATLGYFSYGLGIIADIQQNTTAQDGEFKFELPRGTYTFIKKLEVISEENIEVMAQHYVEEAEASGCLKDEFHYIQESIAETIECKTEFTNGADSPCESLKQSMKRDLIPRRGKYGAFYRGINDDLDTFSIFQSVMAELEWSQNIIDSNNGDFEFLTNGTDTNFHSEFLPCPQPMQESTPPDPDTSARMCYTVDTDPDAEWNILSSYFLGQVKDANIVPHSSTFLGLLPNQAMINSGYGSTHTASTFYNQVYQNNGSPIGGSEQFPILWSYTMPEEHLAPGTYKVSFTAFNFGDDSVGYFRESKLLVYANYQLLGSVNIYDPYLQSNHEFQFELNDTGAINLTIKVDLGCCYNDVPATFGLFGIDDVELRTLTSKGCDCEKNYGLESPDFNVRYPYQCLYSVFEANGITAKGGLNPALLDPSSFITQFQSSWLESMLSVHPEYCALGICEAVNTPESADFINKLQELDWADFVSEYSPTLTYTDELTAAYAEDPLFTTISNFSSNAQVYAALIALQDSMEAKLDEYMDFPYPNASTSLNIFEAASLLGFAPMKLVDGNGDPDLTTLHYLTDKMNDTGAVAHKSRWWRNYATLYLQARQSVVQYYMNGGCGECNFHFYLEGDQPPSLKAQQEYLSTTTSTWINTQASNLSANFTLQGLEDGAIASFRDMFDPDTGTSEAECKDYLIRQINQWLPTYDDSGVMKIDINGNGSGGVAVSTLAEALKDECACNATMDARGTLRLDDPLNTNPSVLWDSVYSTASGTTAGIAYEFSKTLWPSFTGTAEEQFTLTLNPYLLKVTAPHDVFDLERLGVVTSLPAGFDPAPNTSGSNPYQSVANALHNYNTASLTALGGFSNTYAVGGNNDIVLFHESATGTAPALTGNLDSATIAFDRPMIEASLLQEGYENAYHFFTIETSGGADTLRGYYFPKPVFEVDDAYRATALGQTPIENRKDCQDIKTALADFLETPLIKDYVSSTSTPDILKHSHFSYIVSGAFEDAWASAPLVDHHYAYEDINAMIEGCGWYDDISGLGLSYTPDTGQFELENRIPMHPLCEGSAPPYDEQCLDCSLLYKAVMDYQVSGGYTGMEADDINSYVDLADYSAIASSIGLSAQYSGSGFSAYDWNLNYPVFPDRHTWNHLMATKDHQNGVLLVTMLNDADIEDIYQHPDLPLALGITGEDSTMWEPGLGQSSVFMGISAMESALGIPSNSLLDSLSQPGDVVQCWASNNSDGRFWMHFAFKGSDVFHDIRMDYQQINGQFALTDIDYFEPTIYPMSSSGAVYDFVLYAVMNNGDRQPIRLSTTFPVAYACDLPSISLYPQPSFDVPAWQTNCEEQAYEDAYKAGRSLYQNIIDQEQEAFIADYTETCVWQAEEHLYFARDHGGYNYTLYLYDKADNLLATVPPEGVVPLTLTDSAGHQQYHPTAEARIAEFRNDPIGHDTSYVDPFAVNNYSDGHYMQTQYRYNAFNEVIWQSTPDGGISRFHYDPVGRIAFSQNAEQKERGAYSYTLYDAQSRIYESGEVNFDVALDYVSSEPVVYAFRDVAQGFGGTYTSFDLHGDASGTGQIPSGIQDMPSFDLMKVVFDHITYNDWQSLVQYFPRHHVVHTYYDQPPQITLADYTTDHQPNNRGRVSAMYKYETLDGNPSSFDNAMVYHYDQSGNVNRLYREIREDDFSIYKMMEYEYDQLTGNVTTFRYQPGETDQLLHFYSYDTDGRLQRVQTSRNGFTWETDATYQYYRHGPLAVTTMGERSLQQVEYVYNLNGWLKAINGMNDLGEVYGSTAMQEFPDDVFGSELHYNDSDFDPISSTYAGATPDLEINSISVELHNGNIAGITHKQRYKQDQEAQALGRLYQYDQLNRIKSFDEFYTTTTTGSYGWFGISNNIATRYTYDGNGNILNLERTGFKNAVATLMDELSYTYTPQTNQLYGYCENVGDNVFPDDLDNAGVGSKYAYPYAIVSAPGSYDLEVSVCPCIDLTTKDAELPVAADFNCATSNPDDVFNAFMVVNENSGYFEENVACELDTQTVRLNFGGGCSNSVGYLIFIVATVQDAPIYTYDEIGNLVRDESENLDIHWNPIGKVKQVEGYRVAASEKVTSSGGSYGTWSLLPAGVPSPSESAQELSIGVTDAYQADILHTSDIQFDYDPMGERIHKFSNLRESVSYTYFDDDGQGGYDFVQGVGHLSREEPTSQYYVRDATGNIIAMYRLDTTLSDAPGFYGGMIQNLQAYHGTDNTDVYDGLIRPVISKSPKLKNNIMGMSGHTMDDVLAGIDHNDVFDLDNSIMDALMAETSLGHAQAFYDLETAAVKAAIRGTGTFDNYALTESNTMAYELMEDEWELYQAHELTLIPDIDQALTAWKDCEMNKCAPPFECHNCEDIRIADPYDPEYQNCLNMHVCDPNNCGPCVATWNTYDSLANLLTFIDRLEDAKDSLYDSLMVGNLGLQNEHYVNVRGDILPMTLSIMATNAVTGLQDWRDYLDTYYANPGIDWEPEVLPLTNEDAVVEHFFDQQFLDLWYVEAINNTDSNNIDSAASVMNYAGGNYGPSDFFDGFGAEQGAWIMRWMMKDPQRPPGGSGGGSTSFPFEPPYEGSEDFEYLPADPYLYLSYTIKPLEYHLYGSSRLGIIKHYDTHNGDESVLTDLGGKKQYELTDHLGNVRATITNRKLVVDDDTTTNYFDVDLLASMDYYPFGMPMPERWRNYEPEDTATYNVITSQNLPYLIDHRKEKPGANGEMGIVDSTINDYWVGKGAAYSGGSLSLGNLFSGGGNVTSHQTYTTNTGGGTLMMTSSNTELFLQCPTNHYNMVMGLFRKIGPGTLFPLDSIGPDDEVEFTLDVSQFGSNQNYLQVSFLDQNFNIIKSKSPGGLLTLFDTKTVKLTITNSDITGGWNPAAVYYVMVANQLHTDTNYYNTMSATISISNWHIVHRKSVDNIVSDVEANSFVYQPSYRFGFGGQERDDDFYGQGLAYTATYWEYDPRLARRWNVDPLSGDFSSLSPYSAFSNNPIIFNDPKGDCPTGDCDEFDTPSDDNITIDKSATGHVFNSDGQLSSFISNYGELPISYGWNAELEEYTSALDQTEYDDGGFLMGMYYTGANKVEAVGNWFSSGDVVSGDWWLQQGEDFLDAGQHLNILLDGGHGSGARNDLKKKVIDMKNNSAYQWGGFTTNAVVSVGESVLLSKGAGAVLKVTHYAMYGSRTGRVFYSGGKWANSAANVYARQIGGHTIDHTLVGSLLTTMTRATGYKFAKPFWETASHHFAKGSRNSISVVLDVKNLNPDGIWMTIEKPIIQNRIPINEIHR